jgi:hypothetical protein
MRSAYTYELNNSAILIFITFSGYTSPSHKTIHANYPAVTVARVSHCRPEIDPRVGICDGERNISAVFFKKLPPPHSVSTHL